MSAVYLLGLALACSFHRPRPASGTPRSRLVVLIPAHDEAETIRPCIESLLSQQYPRHLYRVVVIADNCTDDTAGQAAAAGAEVMVRRAPGLPGKGRALRWAMDQLLLRPEAPDAIVVMDADTLADSRLLMELESRLAAGDDVVQADAIAQPMAGSPRSQLEAAAVLLRNRVRFSGLMALGLPTGLSGNGMLISREVLMAHPWDAYSPTEDSDYSLKLFVSGVRPVFALPAQVYASTSPTERGAHTQGIRWEGGRLAAMTHSFPRLVAAAIRRRDVLLLATALDHAVPPFAVLTTATAAGTVGAAALVLMGGSARVLVPWAAAAAALPAYVLLGLRAAGAPANTYLGMLAMPQFLYRKLRIYAHLLTHGREREWVRTERAAEVGERRLRS
jgi:hypothetical protein